MQTLGRADPTAWKIAGVGDFNGDGKSDVLWQDVKTGDANYGAVAVWITGGAMQWLGQADPTVWKLIRFRRFQRRRQGGRAVAGREDRQSEISALCACGLPAGH